MKKVLALVLTFALVFSTFGMAFADTTTTTPAAPAISADAKACADLGMLVGDGTGVTVAYTATATTRLQAMVMMLRLKGLLTEAQAFTGTANFADANKAAWAAPIMAYMKAHPELGWVGDGTNIDPNGVLTAQAYYKVMLESLGYKANTAEVIGDFTYPGTIAFAATKGLTKVAAATTFTVDNVATATIEALKAVVKGGTKTLAATLVESTKLDSAKAIAAGVYTAPVVAFVVESVKAINLKQVEVTFNKEVDKSTAEDVTNYKVNGTALVVNTNWATLLEDGKTVRVTLAAARTNLTTATFDVGGVKDANDVLVTTYTVDKLAFTDVNAPSIVSVTAIGPKDIKVIFNEPIQFANASIDFKVNNGTVGIDGAATLAALSPSTNSVVVKLSSSLPAGENTLVVNSNSDVAFKDFANIALAKETKTFTYTADTTVPTVAIKSAAPNKVVLKFNKEVKQVNLAKIYHGYTSNLGVATSVPAGLTYSDEWSVSFVNLLPVGTTTFIVKNSSTSGNEIKDRFGNLFVNTTLDVTAKADSTPPTVTSVTAKSPTKLEIAFSEDVNASDVITKTFYQFLKSDGTVLKNADFADVNSYGYPNANVTMSYDTAKYVLTMNFTTAFKIGDYKLKMTDIRDTVSYQKNTMADATNTFTVIDNNAPKLSAAFKNGSVVELTFTKDMATSGEGSVLDTANYQIKWTNASSPTTLPSGTTIAMGGTNKVVRITLGSTTDYTAQTKISVSAKDSSGTSIDGFNNTATVNVESAIAAGNFGKIKLMDSKTVKFTINRPVRMIDSARVTVAGLPVSSLSYTNKVLSDNVTYGVEIIAKVAGATTADTLDTKLNAVKGNITVQLAAGADPANQINIAIGGIETEMGTANAGAVTIANLVAADAAVIDDYAAPVILSTTTRDANANGQVDKIEVVFSEDVRTATVADNTFSVDGYVIDHVVATTGLNKNTFDIILAEKGIADTDATPEVKLLKDVEDMNTNVTDYTADDLAADAVDGAKPVMLSAKTTAAKTIAITYSEPVTVLATAPTQWVFDADGAGLTVADVTAANTAVAANATNVVTITVTTAVFVTGVAPVAASTVTYTAGAAVVSDTLNNAVTPQTVTGVTAGF